MKLGQSNCPQNERHTGFKQKHDNMDESKIYTSLQLQLISWEELVEF